MDYFSTALLGFVGGLGSQVAGIVVNKAVKAIRHYRKRGLRQ